MNLYEIDEAIMACIDDETGEIIDETALDQLMIERNVKLENVALWIKNLKADEEAYKKEKQSFEEKQRAAKNKIASLENYLKRALNGQKFNTARVQVSFRKTSSVVCQSMDLVPPEFLRTKEPELDKTAIKKAIKDGVYTGCILVDGQSMTIK